MSWWHLWILLMILSRHITRDTSTIVLALCFPG